LILNEIQTQATVNNKRYDYQPRYSFHWILFTLSAISDINFFPVVTQDTELLLGMIIKINYQLQLSFFL